MKRSESVTAIDAGLALVGDSGCPYVAGMQPSDPAISVRNLYVRYGELEAVRGVDLDAYPGELLAVLGTNGAGKTTTLEVLQGARAPSAGSVSVLGLDPYRERHRLAKRLGVMFQGDAVPDELTPQEMLATWHQLKGLKDASVATSLDRVDLTHRSDVPIRRLSGGERRRLDLAVALTGEPELLFLDEPTAGLDPESRTSTWHLVRDLLRRGTTIVLTTHYLEEAEALADRIAILHKGKVEVAGTLDEVVATRGSRIETDLPGGEPPPPDHFTGETRLSAVSDGKRLEIRTCQLVPDLKRLLDWSERHSAPLRHLRASEASLDEVFQHVVESDREEVMR